VFTKLRTSEGGPSGIGCTADAMSEPGSGRNPETKRSGACELSSGIRHRGHDLQRLDVERENLLGSAKNCKVMDTLRESTDGLGRDGSAR